MKQALPREIETGTGVGGVYEDPTPLLEFKS